MTLQVGKQTRKSKPKVVLSVWKSGGFSLIELMVVIAIIATMMGLAVSFVGSTFHVQIKKEAAHVMGAIRYVYNEAARKNISYRIVFDLNENEYWIESGAEDLLVSQAGEEEKNSLSKKDEESDDKSEDEQGENPVSDFIEEDGIVVKRVTLGKEVRIRDVYVSHQGEIITEGQAYLYFFPNGSTELAIVHLSDEDEEVNYSIIVNPLTGKSRVEANYVSYDDLQKE